MGFSSEGIDATRRQSNLRGCWSENKVTSLNHNSRRYRMRRASSFILAAASLFALASSLATHINAAPAPAPAGAAALDYNFFKTRVQPVFLTKRAGHTRC